MAVRQSQGMGPVIPRRRLGNTLRALRAGSGRTLAQVASDLLFSTSKLSRLEKGQAPAFERDVRDLLRYYDQSETALGERMRRWAQEGREIAWFQREPLLSPVTEHYLRYETAAAQVHGYVVHFVPSLLQTADYARALILAMGSHDRSEVERLVDVRMRRQEIVTRVEYPVAVDIVMDESVLHRVVGSPPVMREQLHCLVRSARRPNVSVRVVRFSTGPHPALAEGAFSLFRFRREIDPDVVNIEGSVTDLYVEQPDQVEVYRRLLDGLRDTALDPHDSAELILDRAACY